MVDPTRDPLLQPKASVIAGDAAEMFMDWPWARRTVGALRAAVADGTVAKTELQLYGMDWSQLQDEPADAILADVFARRGAVTAEEEHSAAALNRERGDVPPPPAPEPL